MAPLSFKKGKAANLIKEKDMERMAAYFLILSDQIKLDKNMHKLAAAEIGSTPDSMSVMTGQLLKKLRDGGCYISGSEEGAGAAMPVTTPKATPKKGSAKKRKGGEDHGEQDASPAAKKVARSKKATELEAVKLEDADESKVDSGGNYSQ